MAQWVIERSDGSCYIGTVDSRPVFSRDAPPAIYQDRELAEVRVKGIRRMDPSGHSYEVVLAP